MSNYIISFIFFVIGIFFKYHSSNLTMGSLQDMGPGFYPNMISNLLIIIAILIAAKQAIWKS